MNCLVSRSMPNNSGCAKKLKRNVRDILTEQSNLQRRYRFQFEHLTRAKEDLEVELREFRREQQIVSQRTAEISRTASTAIPTVGTYSSVVAGTGRVNRSRDPDRRTQSKPLHWQIFSVSSNAVKKCVTPFCATSKVGSARTKQQEASLADLVARLEERSQRLNRLRAELDQTQSEILEQRLVTEEARHKSGPGCRVRRCRSSSSGTGSRRCAVLLRTASQSGCCRTR